MFDIGFSEVLLIFVIALVVLGPEKLPRLASQVGRWIGRARTLARQFREQLEEEVNLEQVRKAQDAQPKPAEPPSQTAGQPAGGTQDPNAVGQSSGPQEHGSVQSQPVEASQPQQAGELPPTAGPDPVDFRADTFANAHSSDTFSHAHPTNEYGANPLTPSGAPETLSPQRGATGSAPPAAALAAAIGESTPAASTAQSGVTGAETGNATNYGQRAASGEAYASNTTPKDPSPAHEPGAAALDRTTR
jgi:sec-independent protein translocase protein TatB